MDPSDTVCIEVLRPKNVPEGLLALGTVVQISEIQIKLQITGGIVCLVERSNVNQIYSNLLNESDNPPRLNQLFKVGQQYVCRIVEKRPRKGYADAKDIISTLDPSSIQEDCLPKTLLAIPQVPLQVAIKSIEDHGYQVDIGFKGLTGFLEFSDAKEYCDKRNECKKFLVGQVVRCYTKHAITLDEESRVVHLSLTRESIKNSKFSQTKVSQNIITERCIIPGARSFLTVMRVARDGLIVNFMNEFSGFVGIDHLKSAWHDPKTHYKISDQIECSVLYYNSITKTFALSIRPKKDFRKTLKHFLENYHVGKMIKRAKFERINGTRSVNFKIDKIFKAVANVNDVLNVDISGMTKDEIHLALDSAFPEGSMHRCRIKSINFADLIIVLSMKKDFLELPFVSVEELKPGDFVDAVVKRHVKDGIVVSFGLNLRAIILNVHLNDYVSQKSHKRYPVGKEIRCRVLKSDHDKQPVRVYFTNKEQLMDSDLTIVDSYDKSFKGKSTCSVIIKVKPNGLIVELFNNVKGFIPSRFLSSAPIKNIEDIFHLGQATPCSVYRVDPIRKSLLLGIIPFEQIIEMKRKHSEVVRAKKTLSALKSAETKIERKLKAASKLSKKNVPGLVCGESENKLGDIRRKGSSDANIQGSKRKRESESADDSSREDEPKKLVNRNKSAKRFKFLDVDLSINWSANNDKTQNVTANESESDSEETSSSSSDESSVNEATERGQNLKTRRQRSEEAKLREERLREAEKKLLDPDRPPQSILDFERLVLKTPDSADIWIKYSKFFLNNVETEKARIVCRRALKTINFRMEKEKLKVWLQLLKVEAKYGGLEKFNATLDEAAQTNDRLNLYQGATKVLTSCGELDEAQRIHALLLKSDSKSLELWVDYILFNMEHKKDLDRARSLFDQASKSLDKSDLVTLKSRFAQFEFKFGDVERGKTLFENLLSDNPKRVDLWRVYEGMIKKFGTRQLESEEICEQNDKILQRIAESIDLVSKKSQTR